MIEFEALELYGAHADEERDSAAQREERQREAREKIDQARIALAELAGPAVAIIALRLYGHDVDPSGRAVDSEREKVAWEVLSRVGVPKLRATAVAASLSASPSTPAPIYGAYGVVDQGGSLSAAGEQGEIDPTSVDYQIDQFLQGAAAARLLNDDK